MFLEKGARTFYYINISLWQARAISNKDYKKDDRRAFARLKKTKTRRSQNKMKIAPPERQRKKETSTPSHSHNHPTEHLNWRVQMTERSTRRDARPDKLREFLTTYFASFENRLVPSNRFSATICGFL